MSHSDTHTLGSLIRGSSADLEGVPETFDRAAATYRRDLPKIRAMTDTSTRDGKRLVRAIRDVIVDAERSARAVRALRADLAAAASAADACPLED